MHVKHLPSLIGLSALVGGATGTSNDPTCVPAATITVIERPAPFTITLHDFVYPTTAAGAPQSMSSISIATNNENEGQIGQTYGSTIYNTVVVTIVVDEELSKTEEGPLSFIVVDETTSWIGATPTIGESLVFATSVAVVTLIPQQIPVDVEGLEPITTRKSTITSTITIFASATSKITHGGSFTGRPTGGWNGTTTSANNAPATVESSATPDETMSTAASRFSSYTTLSAPELTIDIGRSTTAVVSGVTLSWLLSSLVLSSTVSQPLRTAASTLSTVTVSNKVSSSTVLSLNTTATVESASVSSTTTDLSTISTSAQVATPSASACGITGDVTLGFDDIPPLSIGNQSIDDVQPLPLFNPYHGFVFSDGFTVVPPPRVPYLPSSKPLLLNFIPNVGVNTTNDKIGPNSREYSFAGDISAADEGRYGCFSFDFYGASFGCDSRSAACLFTISGYKYSEATTGILDQVAAQTITIPACPQLVECPLTSVSVEGFTNLDIIRTRLTVGGVHNIWWVDDVRLGWSDDSCKAGICRKNAKIPKGPWGN